MPIPQAGNDEEARKMLLEFDQGRVGEAAMKHGKEVWGSMSWKDRLDALREHLDPTESPPPVVKAPPQSAAKPPPTPPIKTSTPVSQSLTPAAAPQDFPLSEPPKVATPIAPTPISPAAPVAVSPSNAPATPLVTSTRERADSHISMVSKMSKKTSVYSTTSVPKPTPPASAHATPIAVPLTPLAPPPASNISASPSVVSIHSVAKTHSAIPSNTRSRTQSIVSQHSVTVTPRPPTPRTPLDAQPIATLPVGAVPPNLPKTPLKAKQQKVLKTQQSSFDKCEACDSKDVKIEELEATLVEWQQQAGYWKKQAEESNGEALMAELEASRQREQEANLRAEALEEQLQSAEDPSILMSQVWTLEKALALRNSEITRLTDILSEFTTKIEQLDAKLAQALKKLVAETRAEFSAEEKELFGMTVGEAMTEFTKKRKRGRRASSSSKGGKMSVLEAEINQIRVENEELKARFRSKPIQANITNTVGYNNQVKERDSLVQSLQEQLSKAQEAILSGVETGVEMRRESELKLRETRGVLKNLIKHQSGQFTSFNSKQPSRGPGGYDPIDMPIWVDGVAPQKADPTQAVTTTQPAAAFLSYPSAVSGIPQSILPIHPSRCRNISPPRIPSGRFV